MKDKTGNSDFLLILDISKTDSELKIKFCMLMSITQHPNPIVTSFVCCYKGLDVQKLWKQPCEMNRSVNIITSAILKGQIHGYNDNIAIPL